MLQIAGRLMLSRYHILIQSQGRPCAKVGFLLKLDEGAIKYHQRCEKIYHLASYFWHVTRPSI